MKKIASFIVNHRKFIMVLFLIMIVYCVWGMSQVKIEYSITAYLPERTDTKQALDIMDKEFVTFGSATMMIRNISFEDALALHDEIEKLDGVKSFTFNNTDDYYKNSCALFSITFDGDEEDEKSVAAYNKIVKMLEGRDVLISSPLVNTYADDLQKDVRFVLIIAVIIIVAVLAFTSKSLGEIPVFLLTFAVAAIMNMGTNYWLGTISFISNSVCVVLQLALAIDYAIILCHRFAEEKNNYADAKDAMKAALSKAIPEIASSSLTTIAGLLALTTMALRLGADLGLVLAKSIVFSMISVFLFMPGVTLLLSKAIDKTTHRNLVPKITFIGKFNVKMRYIIPAVFLVLVSVASYFSFQTQYVYSSNSIDTPRPSDTQAASRAIDDVFGYRSALAILVPKGDYSLEKRVIETVEKHEEVKEALGISNVEISANGQTHTLTEKLSYRRLGALLGANSATAASIYRAYAYFSADDTNDGLSQIGVFEANRDLYTVSLLELMDCALEHDDFISAYLYDDTDMLETYQDLRDTIRDAEDQLIGTNYTRAVFVMNCFSEGEQTFALVRELLSEVKSVCPDAIFAGDITSSYDLNESFSTDNLKISLLTVLFVFVILMFTFRSWGLPIPLALTIQGAIFITFALYALSGTNLFFFVYLIVSAIQMGATIDYAIVFTNRYKALKQTMDKKQAVIEALNGAFPTILTSGSIMATASFLIGSIVGDPLIATLGTCLGKGVLISIACVMFVLPTLLLTFDKLLDKTNFKPRQTEPISQKLKKLKSAVHGTAYASDGTVYTGIGEETETSNSEEREEEKNEE